MQEKREKEKEFIFGMARVLNEDAPWREKRTKEESRRVAEEENRRTAIKGGQLTPEEYQEMLQSFRPNVELLEVVSDIN
jgi:hypothetical protein